MAVLDQENSKKFLLGTEKDKYELFLKATDLGRISDVREEKKMQGVELRDWLDGLEYVR